MRKLIVKKGVLTEGDISFLWQKGMPSLGIDNITIKFSRSKKIHPDIWCSIGEKTITVTREWQKQSGRERKCRLVHELLHFKGLEHGRYGNLEYSTYPWKDSYSKKIYRDILMVM